MQHHPQLQQQQQWSEAVAGSSLPFTAPFKGLGLGSAETQPQELGQKEAQQQQPNGFHAPAATQVVSGTAADAPAPAAANAPAAGDWATPGQFLPPSAFELAAAGVVCGAEGAVPAATGQPVQVHESHEQEQQAEPMIDDWQQQQEQLRQQQQQEQLLQQQQQQEQLLRQQQQQQQEQLLRQQQQQQQEQLLRQQQQQQQEQLRLQQQQEQLRQQQQQERLRRQQQQHQAEPRFSLGLDGFDDGLGFLSHAGASRDIAAADNRQQQQTIPPEHQLAQQPASGSFGAAAAAAAGGGGGGGGGGGALSLLDEGDDFGFTFSKSGGPQPSATAATQQSAMQPAGANPFLDLDDEDVGGSFADQPSTALQPGPGGPGLKGTTSHPVGVQGSGLYTQAHRVSSRYGSMFGGHAIASSAAAGSGAAQAAAAGSGGADTPGSPSAATASHTAGEEAVSHDDIYKSFGLGRATNKYGANAGLLAGLAPVRARQGADDELTRWLEHTSAVAAQQQQQSQPPRRQASAAGAGGARVQPAASSSPRHDTSGTSSAAPEAPPPPPPPASAAPSVPPSRPPAPPPPPPEEVQQPPPRGAGPAQQTSQLLSFKIAQPNQRVLGRGAAGSSSSRSPGSKGGAAASSSPEPPAV